MDKTDLIRISEIVEQDYRAAGLDEYPVLPIVEDVTKAILKAGFTLMRLPDMPSNADPLPPRQTFADWHVNGSIQSIRHTLYVELPDHLGFTNPGPENMDFCICGEKLGPAPGPDPDNYRSLWTNHLIDVIEAVVTGQRRLHKNQP